MRFHVAPLLCFVFMPAVAAGQAQTRERVVSGDGIVAVSVNGGPGRLRIDPAAPALPILTETYAQRAGLLVVGASALDAERLGYGNLDVVDVAAVPDRLEDAVGEAEDEQVLDGVLPQVVVDAVDLLFSEGGSKRLV